MQEQRFHQERAAARDGAQDGLRVFHQLRDAFRALPPSQVRTGNDSQGGVRFVVRVEMKPDGQHALKDFGGRLHVRDARFLRPRAEAFGVSPRTHRDWRS